MAGEARHPARRLAGRIAGLFRTEGTDFQTTRVLALDLGFDGIEGDRHGGATRRTGGREPWYRRGTEIRNERQLSLVSPDELRTIAERLGIAELAPEWLGANLLIEGVPALTRLPPRTVLLCEGGASIRIDGDNAPCRASGRAVASRTPGRPEIETDFAKAAKGLRGLVGFVEKPGRIVEGEAFEARVPAQHLY